MEPQKNKQQNSNKKQRPQSSCLLKKRQEQLRFNNYNGYADDQKDQTSVQFMSDYEFDDNEEININLNHNYPQSKQSVNSSKQDIIEKNIRFTKSLSPSKNKLNSISKTDLINKQKGTMQFNKSDDSQLLSNNVDIQKQIKKVFTGQQDKQNENNDQQVQNECEENKKIENLENGNKKNLKKTSINSKQKLKLEKKKEKLEKKKEQERIIKEQRQKKKFEKQQQQKEQQQKIINETIEQQNNLYEENNKKMYRLEYQKIKKKMQNLDIEIQKYYQKLIDTLNNIKQNKKCFQKMRQANEARQKYDQAIKQIQIEIDIMEQKLKNLPIIDSQNSLINFNAKNIMIKREQNIAAFFSKIEQCDNNGQVLNVQRNVRLLLDGQDYQLQGENQSSYQNEEKLKQIKNQVDIEAEQTNFKGYVHNQMVRFKKRKYEHIKPTMQLNEYEFKIVKQLYEQIRDYNMFYGPDKIYLLDHIQFKLGGNFVYSECALVFAFARKLGDDLVTYWCPIMDPYDLVERRFDFDQKQKQFFMGERIINSLKFGIFIVNKGFWGYLLDLSTVKDIYDGIICDDLQELLKEPMFQDMFDKYAYFMMDDLNQNSNQQEKEQNQINEVQIKTTQDDLSIEDYYIPFYKDLFEHQKQEVGWMFNCEQHPYINIKGNMICIPILDSGYYAIPDGENIKIIQKNDIQSVKLSNFGGILGSEIGSGKTASIIGLTSLGYQIDNFTEQMALQQTFQQEDQQNNIQIEEYKQQEENENKKKEIQMNEQNQVFRDEQMQDQDDKFDLMSHDLQLHKKVFSREIGFHDNQLFKQDNLENKKIELLKTQLKQNFKNVYLPSLIIVTKNILYQWAEEYEKFAPFLKIKVVENSKDFLNLKIKEKFDSDQNKFQILQEFNILITHREAIIDIYQLDKTFSSQLFQINFRRVVYDEIHEITNIYDKRQKEKEYQPHKINNNLYTHIDLFYQVAKKLKTQFIWGMTGTLQNLNYRNNSESLAILLQLDDKFNDQYKFKEINDKFLQKFIRANPRSIVLPQLIKDVQYIDFDQIQKLLYRGKLENRQGEKYAREICSHFTSQFKHLENLQDQFEIAIDIIQKELNAQIFSIKEQILLEPNKKQQLVQRLQNYTGENNFYNELICALTKEKFSFNSDFIHKQVKTSKKNLQLVVKNDDNNSENEGKIALMTPGLKTNKKYEMFFKIDSVNKQKKLALGLFQLYRPNPSQINVEYSNYHIKKCENNCISVREFQDEEIMIKNMNYQRFFFIEPALKQNKNYIFEYNFKIRSCGGKGLISIGICKKYFIKKRNLLHDPNENIYLNNLRTEKKPENREKYLGHGCYMIRQDGLELNHHDVGQNLYYTQFQFNEGDEVKMTIDFNDETITYLNLNTNQRYKQYFNLQLLINPQVIEYKMEQGKQKSKADQDKIKKFLISKKKKELEKELKSLKQDQEVQNGEKKDLQIHIQSQLNLLEQQENSLQFLENIEKILNLNLDDEFENNKIVDQNYYDDINTLDITICGLIYDFQDQIELVGSQKQINIKQKIFDPLENNFEAQMITADGFVYDGQNQKKIDRFGFEKGDRIKLQIDLVENQLNYLNLTTKQEYSQQIQQNQYNYNVGFILYDEDDQITNVEQLFIFECPLCFEDLPKNKLVVTNCLHQVCTKCYDALTSQQMAACPYCKQILDDKQVMVHPRLQRKTKSKIQMLVEQIKMIDEDDKIIVYTQFHDLTLKIANLLEETNIQYFILKGEPSEVNIRLQKFKKQPDIKVLIMSIEQAASGINIVEANHVIFVHPIFGMNREKSQITYAQCIGRAYRIGQKKKVYTNVYVTNDSIEEEAYKPFENIFMNIKKQ